MPLRYGQRLGLSFAWSARRDMGLGTDAVAGLGVAAYGEPSRGNRQAPDKAVVSCPSSVVC